MSKLLYVLTCSMLMSACCTTKVISDHTDIDAVDTHHVDSTHVTTIDSVTNYNVITHIYDSIFTHITIVRYDTLHRVFETIDINNCGVTKTDIDDNKKDSIHIQQDDHVVVSDSTSVKVKEEYDKETEQGTKLKIFLLFLVIVGVITITLRIIR